MNKQTDTFSKLYEPFSKSHEQYVNPTKTNPTNIMRTFAGGATRHTDDDKLDYEGFLSPLVLQRYAEYLHAHRIQADGKLRASDNWQKGIPKVVYMKSLLRHLLNVWRHHRNYPAPETLEESLCAVMFNTMGYLFETLHTKEQKRDLQPGSHE